MSTHTVEASHMLEHILLDINDSIATLTLNRPERHNSLIPALLRSLIEGIEIIHSEPKVLAVVFKANGRSFSTGGDIRALYENRGNLQKYASTLVGLLNQVILGLVDLHIPVVAAVHGIVTGGSLGLVLACDLVLVSPDASFTPYYSDVGFSPDGGWIAMLPEIIGRKRTSDILMRNQTISASDAVGWGMANQVVPADQIIEVAHQLAQDIAHKKPGSTRNTKQLLREFRPDLPERLEVERVRFVQQITREEAMHGMAAYLNVSS